MDIFEDPWNIDIPSPSIFQNGESEPEEINLLSELGIEDTDNTDKQVISDEPLPIKEIDKTRTPPVEASVSFVDMTDNVSEIEVKNDKPPEAPFDESDITNPFTNGTGFIPDSDKKYIPENKIREYYITNLFTLINIDNKTDQNEVDVLELDFNADFGNLRISMSRLQKAMDDHKLFKSEMKRVVSIAVYPEDCLSIYNAMPGETVYCIEKLINRTNEPWEINRPQCFVSNLNELTLPEIQVENIQFSYQDMLNAGWTHDKILNSDFSALAEKAEKTDKIQKRIIQVNIGDYYFKLINSNHIECFMESLRFIYTTGFMLKVQRGFLSNGK